MPTEDAYGLPAGAAEAAGQAGPELDAAVQTGAAQSDAPRFSSFREILSSLDAPFLLAPLAGFSDSAFRYICAMHGASLCYTEMLSAKGLCYGSRGSEAILKMRAGEAPLGIQLFGHEPEFIARAAESLRSLPNVLIDINMGCPVPKVVKNGEGSALLKDPKLAAECVRAAVLAAGKPVTVKMRRGFSDADGSSDKPFDPAGFAALMEEAGASAICVHGRTREQYYSGKADWDSVKRVKEAVSVPVIGNGDVFCADDAMRMFEHTGCDAVMAARGAMGDPWLFEEMRAAWRGEPAPKRPDPAEIVETVRLHYRLLAEDKGEYTALREMRGHASFYTRGIRGSAELRRAMNTAATEEEFFEVLGKLGG